MQKAVYFIIVSLLLFASCKKDASNPVNADTVPVPPTLASPTDTSSNIEVPVVLSWKESSGAKSYTLQVSASSSFSNFVFNKSDITTTTQQVPDLNYLAVYYWRVSATNSAGTSDWSKVWSFTTTGEAAFVPQLALPANGAVDQKLSPVLTWDKVNNASKYTLQISTNSSFTSFVLDEDSLTTASKQINDLSGATKYYWRVSAVNNFGTKGWSETWSFTTGVVPTPPILLSPNDGATYISITPTLSWNASNGATSYNLQVAVDYSFANMIYNNNVGNVLNKEISGLSGTTKYYWRVSTTNNIATSNHSDIRSFTTAADLVTYGPIQIWESTGTTASQPGGLDLSAGNAYGISSSNKADVDIYYSTNGYVVTSADNSTGLTRKTYFQVGSANVLSDGIPSSLKDNTWSDKMADRQSKYVFLYDTDMHYSKIIIDSYGGGTPGNPAWIKVKWIYNKTKNDVNFK